MMLRLVTAALLLVAGLPTTGCGGSEPEAPAGKASTDSTKARPPQPAAPENSADARDDFCSLLPVDEMSAAFGGKLSFSVVSPGAKSCEYRIDGYEGGQFISQWMRPENYALTKQNLEEGRVQGEILEGLGQEAVLLNNGTHLAISIDDENAVSLIIILFVFGEEVPVTNEETAAALTKLGKSLVGRF